jgi:uncharacterized protein (TIGR02594 family)
MTELSTKREPPWMEAAKKELGVAEIAGPESNPRIRLYYTATALGGDPEDTATPWCSAFVNFVLEQAGYKGTRRANARSWLDWGDKLEQPRHGCIAVLWRNRPESPQGHVAFYDRERDPGSIWLLGGNQGNRVSYAHYPKRRVLEYRWPKESDRWMPKP